MHLHKLAFQMGMSLMQDLAGTERLLGGLAVLGHRVKVSAHTTGRPPAPREAGPPSSYVQTRTSCSRA